MRQTRRHLGGWAATTLVAFVAAVAAPRPGFLVHQHAGGGHRHLHLTPAATEGDIDRLLAEALGTHRHTHGADARPHFEVGVSGDPGASHWHDQAPFQPAIAVGRPTLDGLCPFHASASSQPLAVAAAPLHDTRARSPPAA